MKYTIIFTGITVLSSITQAACLPRFSKVEITNAYSTRDGPEFPVTLRKRKDKRGDALGKRSKPHCAAPGQWKCYRKNLKDSIRKGEQFDSDDAKEFCNTTGEHRPDCDASDEDEVTPKYMADILREIEEDKKKEEKQKLEDKEKADLEAAKEAAKMQAEIMDEIAEKERVRLEALKPDLPPFADPLRIPDESELLPPQ